MIVRIRGDQWHILNAITINITNRCALKSAFQRITAVTRQNITERRVIRRLNGRFNIHRRLCLNKRSRLRHLRQGRYWIRIPFQHRINRRLERLSSRRHHICNLINRGRKLHLIVFAQHLIRRSRNKRLKHCICYWKRIRLAQRRDFCRDRIKDRRRRRFPRHRICPVRTPDRRRGLHRQVL